MMMTIQFSIQYEYVLRQISSSHVLSSEYNGSGFGLVMMGEFFGGAKATHQQIGENQCVDGMMRRDVPVVIGC
jgi:hypothetical protein